MIRSFLAALLLVSVFGTVRAETFVLVSDINGRYGSTHYHERVADAVDRAVRIAPRAVLSPGDLVAGQKQPKLDREWLDRMWAAFDGTVAQPLAAAGIPLLTTPGNHDGSALHGFELERERYAEYWSGRGPGLELLPGSEWPRRYAARLGDVLLVAFDGTRPGLLPAAEYDFVRNMLDRYGDEAACTLVMGHLPMWPLALGREREIIDDPALLELLHRDGVDAYLSGHHHVFYPGVDEAGMLHLAVAALGGNARAFSGHLLPQPHGFAVLEHAGDALRVTALDAPDFSGPAARERLPGSVSGPLGVLRRLDGDLALRP